MEITPVEFSAERIEIGKALLKAQGAIEPFKKTESNPLYNSKYADLSTVIDAIKGALQGAGIVLLQGGSVNPDGTLGVETMLLHAESGQWARNVLTLMPVPDVVSRARDGGAPITAVTPQTIGKTITYGRRYGLQALLGIAAEDDDDGNGASGKPEATVQPTKEYKLESPQTVAQWTNPTKQADGLTEIAGKLTNWRERKYPDGGVVHFGNINAWGIWTKKEELAESLSQAQGTFIHVVGKRSKNKPNLFEVVSWRLDEPAEGPA